MKLYILRNAYDKTIDLTLFSENWSMFQFLAHVELSRSMTAILEMLQYVAYQKNVAYTFIKLSAKPHSFNILRTMGVLSCPTNYSFLKSASADSAQNFTINEILLIVI